MTWLLQVVDVIISAPLKAKESCADDMSMVQCSNDECRNMLGEHNANWFHYACVNFNPDVDTDFYCSDNCRKKKRKNR